MRSLDSFSYLVEPIDELLDIMNQTISQTRSLTSEISPPVLYELGLEPAIKWLGEKLLKQKGIIFEFISDGQPKLLTDDIRIILFQSVRELLVNILKHSHAKSVIVSIKRDGDYLQFTIEDDGIGFDTSRIVSTESFGIFNIRERIELIGESIEIRSEPGKGTQITIRVPLKR
jgi:signal transduction histidine kinase